MKKTDILKFIVFFIILLTIIVMFSSCQDDYIYDMANGLYYKPSKDNSGLIVASCDKDRSIIDIPSSYNNQKVISIGAKSFKGCKVAYITIPNSVKTIEKKAFKDCSELRSLDIQSGVISIGNKSFSGCKSLTSVTLPNSVTSIGNYAFSDCEKLEVVVLNNGVTTIGHHAFADCVSLEIIEMSNSVTTIGHHAFYNCINLENIEIPTRITTIERYTFSYCEKLVDVYIPDNVTSIGSSAFSDCKNLESIRISSSVTSIGGYAFSNCTKFSKIIYPDILSRWNKIEKGYNWDEGTGDYTGVFAGDTGYSNDNSNTHTHIYTKYTKYDDTQHKCTCDTCGEEKLEQHDWNSGAVTIEPTSTSTGIKTYFCKKCGQTKTETITSSHTHTYTKYTKYDNTQHKCTCDACGEEKLEQHDWDSGTVTKEPTSTSNGVKTYTCKKCGQTKTETITSSHTHTYTKYTKYDNTQHKCKCDACGEEKLEQHDWDSGTVTKEPTNVSTGIKSYTCKKCGAKKEEVISKLELNNSNKLSYYKTAWENTEQLDSYTSNIDINIKTAFLGASVASINGQVKATSLHSDPWFNGLLEIKVSKTSSVNINNSTGNIKGTNKSTGKEVVCNFFKFGENVIKKLPDAVIMSSTVKDGTIEVSLNENDAKALFADMLDYASLYQSKLNEYKLENTKIIIYFKNGCISKYEFSAQLIGSVKANLSGSASIVAN